MRSVVLIADESITNRKMLANILKTEYSIMEASTRTQTLTVLENNADFITISLISDTLAFEGEKNLFEEIMHNSRIAKIPVVMTSSNVDKNVISKAINYGVYDYILWPFVPEIVLNRLRNIIALRLFALETSKKSVNNSKRQIESIQNMENESSGYMHFNASTYSIEKYTGFYKENSNVMGSYRDFYKFLKQNVKESDEKVDVLNKLSPENVRKVVTTDYSELEQDVTIIDNGEERNLKFVLKGYESEKGADPMASLIAIDSTLSQEKEKIYSILNKNENEVICIINQKKDFVRYREINTDNGELLPEKYMSYDELIKTIYKILKVDPNGPIKYDLSKEYVIDKLQNSNEYDCVFHYQENEGRLFKRVRFQYFDEKQEKILVTIANITSQFEMDALTCKLNYQGFVNAARTLAQQNPYDLSLITVVFKNYKEVSELAGKDAAEEFVSQIYRKLDDSSFAPIIMGRSNEYFYMLVKKYKLEEKTFKQLNVLKYQKQGKEFTSNLRFGIYDVPQGNSDIEDMINKSLIAEQMIDTDLVNIYQFYSDKIIDPTINQSTISYAIERALDDDELVPYFQPIIDVNKNEVVMAEALIRWKKNGDLLQPADFIPVLEKSGLISITDRKMIELINEVVSKNRRVLGNIPITVNLSRIDFFDNKLVNTITESLSSNKKIYYEITESVDISMNKEINAVIKKIKKGGSKVLLDDFGSGYSTYGSLFESAFDIIKIDAELIGKISESPLAEATIKSIIDMAHAGGMKVISEGVETKEQFRFLRENGSDYIQGYYFSSPLPENQFVNYVNEYNN